MAAGNSSACSRKRRPIAAHERKSPFVSAESMLPHSRPKLAAAIPFPAASRPAPAAAGKASPNSFRLNRKLAASRSLKENEDERTESGLASAFAAVDDRSARRTSAASRGE